MYSGPTSTMLFAKGEDQGSTLWSTQALLGRAILWFGVDTSYLSALDPWGLGQHQATSYNINIAGVELSGLEAPAQPYVPNEP